MTKVLRIIARMNVGGPAQQITGLLSQMDGRFEQVLAIGHPDDGEEDWIGLRAPWLADDPRVVTIPALGRPIRPGADNQAYRQLRSLIRHVRPDVVHTHTTKAGLVGRMAAWREGVPAVVHTYHGHVLQGYLGSVQTAGVKVAERRLASRSDVLLSVGARVRDELLEAGIGRPEQYVVVPPGVTPPRQHTREAARVALGLGEEVPVVAFVARVTDVKRPDRLVEVADRVAREQPDTVFLVGGGAETAELTRLRSSVGEADIRFLGWWDDVGQLYAAADLVLLTSDAEGMPVSLIEAGMCGRACVATDVGSVAEVVLDGRTGHVVPTEVEPLATAVLGLLDDPQRRQSYGDAAREHTHASFSMDRLVATTEAVYDRVLDGDRPRSGGVPGR